MSEAIHRFGVLMPERAGLLRRRPFPSQSGDSADSVAAVQNLAANRDASRLAPAPGTAVSSEAIPRFGGRMHERAGSLRRRRFPNQSGDSADFVAAVQDLAAESLAHDKSAAENASDCLSPVFLPGLRRFPAVRAVGFRP